MREPQEATARSLPVITRLETQVDPLYRFSPTFDLPHRRIPVMAYLKQADFSKITSCEF